MISGINMTQPNSVSFQGRFSNMKERYNDMSKGEKAAVIAGTTAGAAAITAGIIVRKDIKTLFKTGNFKQFFHNAGQTLKKAAGNVFEFLKHPIKGIKKMFGKKKSEPITLFSNRPEHSNVAKEMLNVKRRWITEDIVNEMDAVNRRTTPEAHAKVEKELIKMFNEQTSIISRKDYFEALFKDAQARLGEAQQAKHPDNAKIDKLYKKVLAYQEQLSRCKQS
ncbi:hypothetical protein J6E39_03165 [bacterium]|nr:hypothetical protein [bacterium]